MAAGIPRPLLASRLAAGALHVAALAVVTWATAGAPPPLQSRVPSPAPAREPAPRIVFLSGRGTGGGGGGGGNRQLAPVRQARAPGRDAATLRVAKPVVSSAAPRAEAPRSGQVVLDAVPLGTGGALQPGLPSGGVDVGTSLGPGTGGGVGTGTGTGIGSGTGPGLGPGSGGGTGGGPYRPGGAVTTPRVLLQVQPRYTSAALADRIQGSVELELVVDRQGLPTRIRIVRSLDRGLDEEAVAAVSRWRFEPGRLTLAAGSGQAGQPVDVLVTVILDFHVR